jgi:hypothetical protein
LSDVTPGDVVSIPNEGGPYFVVLLVLLILVLGSVGVAAVGEFIILLTELVVRAIGPGTASCPGERGVPVHPRRILCPGLTDVLTG